MFAAFLKSLGNLHDAQVTKFELNLIEQCFSLAVDDIYSNFEGLPYYKGPMAAEIVLIGISHIKIAFEPNTSAFTIYEFTVEDIGGSSGRASIKFWPEGEIEMNFVSVQYPRSLKLE